MAERRGFLDELKERHVVRVGLVYGAVAFGVVQLADIAVPALGLPDLVMTAILVVAALGFPLALVLAWAFEISPERPVPESEAPNPSSARWLSPRSLAVVAGFVVVGCVAWFAGARTAARPAAGAATSAAGIHALAIIPFDDLSPGADQAYFSEGLTDELRIALNQVPGVRVAGQTSTSRYRGVPTDARRIGQELAVGWIVVGNVRRANEQLRVSARLENTDDGFEVWAATYDETFSLDAVFSIQEQIARAIADGLRVPLGLASGETLVRTQTGRLDAYELYLQAKNRYRNRFTVADLDAAIGLFGRALEIDPQYALAQAGLAEAWIVRPNYTPHTADSWRSSLARGEQAAAEALALEPDLGRARLALANLLRDRWEWDAARPEYLSALRALPNDAEAWHEYGEYLLNLGDAEGAAEAQRRAIAIDPLSGLFHGWLARALLVAGRPGEALEAARRGVEVEGNPVSRRTWSPSTRCLTVPHGTCGCPGSGVCSAMISASRRLSAAWD